MPFVEKLFLFDIVYFSGPRSEENGQKLLMSWKILNFGDFAFYYPKGYAQFVLRAKNKHITHGFQQSVAF